jgi:copper transport protein
VIFARWVLYVGALGLIGAFGATLLRNHLDPRVVRAARVLSIAFAAATAGIFAVQRYVWFGGEGITEWDNAWLIVSSTVWGKHWTWLAIVAVSALTAIPVAGRRPGWWIAATAALTIAIAATVPLIGHAGSHDTRTRILHGVHLTGGGLWMGSLALTIFAGLKDRSQLLVTLRRFAPLALTGAAMVSVSGLVIAWEHVQPLSALWSTTYGRVLTAKIAVVIAVSGLGFLNWRQPAIALAIVEAAIAFTVVLALTAWLSELPVARMRGH